MTIERWRADLIARRRRAGMSVGELAARLGLPANVVLELEEGSLQPDGDLRRSWGDVLDQATSTPGRRRWTRRSRPS